MSKSFYLTREAYTTDVSYMVSLSHAKRRTYEKAQPQFWRYKEGAEEAQSKWFRELINSKNYVVVITELLTDESVEKNDTKMLGFAIGKLMEAPEVYDPKGLTLMIDDFCVEDDKDWSSVGGQLIEYIKSTARRKGASQILVVCGTHDEPKRQLLKELDLNVVSEWYSSAI